MSAQVILNARPETESANGTGKRYAHFVDRRKLTDAIVFGREMTAICGTKFIPSRAPEKFPVCEQCRAVWETLT